MSGDSEPPELIASSAECTLQVGRALGEILGEGEVVGLSGELGSGKTTLARGVITGLGVDDRVVSPSFTIIREYEGRLRVFHLDLYRLRTEGELLQVGVPDYLASDGVALVEWCERLGSLSPADRLEVELRQGALRGDRHLIFRPHGRAWEAKLGAGWPRLARAAAPSPGGSTLGRDS